MTNVRVTPIAGGQRAKVEWDAAGGTPVFNVQVSAVDGVNKLGWATVAVGLTQKSFVLEKTWNWDDTFMSWDKAFVRVMATNVVDAIFSTMVAVAPAP